MKNKKIASILLALTICIQNTACMQVKNGGNEISSSVVASSFDNTSEVLEDEDDEEDITKTLQFFLDELSKVKGIEDKIEFSNEEIENYLNTDDAIKCTDKTLKHCLQKLKKILISMPSIILKCTLFLIFIMLIIMQVLMMKDITI